MGTHDLRPRFLFSFACLPNPFLGCKPQKLRGFKSQLHAICTLRRNLLVRLIVQVEGFIYGARPSVRRLAFSRALSSRSNWSRRSLSLTSSARSCCSASISRDCCCSSLPTDSSLVLSSESLFSSAFLWVGGFSVLFTKSSS